MNRMNGRYVAVALIGIVIGCAAATVLPPRAPFAQPAQGQWRCFSNNQWDKGPEKAAAGDYMRAFTSGLNQVAAHVPAGTIITPIENGSTTSWALTCVKY